MKEFFKDKFEYNHLCNSKIIDLIRTRPEGYSEKAKILISHTLNAQNIWNHRLLGLPPTQNVWDVFDLSRLTHLNAQNHHQSLEILEKLDLKTTINYRNSKGLTFSNSAEHILYHIINHSTYHRGQLMSELKTQGFTPISTDFIFFKR